MKYLEDGTAVNVIAQWDGGFVVCPILQNTTDNYGDEFGDAINVRRVYNEPPTARVEKSIAEAETRLEAVRKELSESRESIRALADERKRLESLASQNAAIKRIVDFLVVGISHLVTEDYGAVYILDPRKEKSGDDRNSRDLRLVSLFGRSNGNLEWGIHKYYDHSSSNTTMCTPFTNIEEATEFAKKRIAELLVDKENRWKESTIKSAVKFGVPVPEDVANKQRELELSRLINALNEKRKQFDDAQKAVDNFGKD